MNKKPGRVLAELSLSIVVVILANSCAFDSVEDLYGLPDFVCDPQEVGFLGVILPIIETNCAIPGCHTFGTQRVNFEIFVNIQDIADDIKSRTTSGDMPKGGGSLSQEEIDQISCWVDSGADILN